MKDKGQYLIVVLVFLFGLVTGMIFQQHKVIRAHEVNKAYKEEILKRYDEIKEIKKENINLKIVVKAQSEIMEKAIKEIEVRRAEVLYYKKKYEEAMKNFTTNSQNQL